jgi:hypothetical protein
MKELQAGALRRAALVLSVFAGALALPGTAAAHEAEPSPAQVARALGGPNVVPSAAGLYRVLRPGAPALLTHGPDSRAEVELGTTATTAGSTERAPLCAADHFQHFVYARLSGQPDRLAEVAGQLRSIVRRADAILDRDSRASGGPSADYRVLCDPAGEILVEEIVVNSVSFSAIADAVEAEFDYAGADATVFADARQSGVCGVGSFSADSRLASYNRANQGGGVAIVYQPCWSTTTMMHENGHNLGAVQYGSPHSTGSGAHCWDEADIMCYSPDGGDLHQSGTVTLCSDAEHFDRGFDDCFDSAPESGEYLDSHWNLGSPLNGFLAFGESSSTPPPPPPPPPNPVIERLYDRLTASGRSASAGGWRLYRLRVPGHARRLRLSLGGASSSGNLDLYLRRGRLPGLGSYKRRAASGSSPETISLGHPRRGTWFIGVYTRSGSGQGLYRLRSSLRF